VLTLKGSDAAEREGISLRERGQQGRYKDLGGKIVCFDSVCSVDGKKALSAFERKFGGREGKYIVRGKG